MAASQRPLIDSEYGGPQMPERWRKIDFLHCVINVDGAPVPGAVWAETLVNQHGLTYEKLDQWLLTSGADPSWEYAICAGFNSQGSAYIWARNIDIS